MGSEEVTALSRGSEVRTVEQGFRATQAFLDTWWRTGLKKSDEIANILGSMEPTSNGMPLDEALWHDWLEAVDRTR